MLEKRTRRILVLGAPRSGTSWTAQMLCQGGKCFYADEPDSHFKYPSAVRAKYNKGLFPVADGQTLPAELEQLWRVVFGLEQYPAKSISNLANLVWHRIPGIWKDYAVTGGEISAVGKAVASLSRLSVPLHPDPTQKYDYIIAKSVHAAFYAPELVGRLKLDAVVVNVRPVEEIIGSWLSLGYWPLEDYQQGSVLEKLNGFNGEFASKSWPADSIRSVVWSVVAMQLALYEYGKRMGWVIFDHARVCNDPEQSFKMLYRSVGLDWCPSSEAMLEETTSTDGKGYETCRLTSKESGKWRSRLDQKSINIVEQTLKDLGIALN